MTSLTHSWSSLISGNIYKIKINAVNSIGSSEYSSDQYVTIASVPDPVSGLTKESLSSTSITIKYDIPSNNNGASIIGYNIYLDNSLLEQTTSLTYSYSSLTKEKQYTMSVSAVNIIGESSLESITFYACDIPSVPGDPTLLSSSSTTISFKWSYSTDNGGCMILMKFIIKILIVLLLVYLQQLLMFMI